MYACVHQKNIMRAPKNIMKPTETGRNVRQLDNLLVGGQAKFAGRPAGSELIFAGHF